MLRAWYKGVARETNLRKKLFVLKHYFSYDKQDELNVYSTLIDRIHFETGAWT